jgi:hypothetical protein
VVAHGVRTTFAVSGWKAVSPGARVLDDVVVDGDELHVVAQVAWVLSGRTRRGPSRVHEGLAFDAKKAIARTTSTLGPAPRDGGSARTREARPSTVLRMAPPQVVQGGSG